MSNPPAARRLLTLLIIIASVLVIAVAFFAVQTQGFGYFVPPTGTPSPTSTIMMLTASVSAFETATPFQPMPTFTSTPTATPTSTPTETPTSTPWPTNTPRPPATAVAYPTNPPSDGLPATARVSGVSGVGQSHALSCESRTAVDWAAFYGVSIGEDTFQNSLPVSDNPDKGYVGNVDGGWGLIPPNDYGVHAEPVAAVLRSFGVSATASRGVSFTELRRQVASGNPVMVWVVGNVWGGSGVSYTASDGATTTVAYNEHTVMFVGYDETGVYIVDGYSTYWRSTATFKSSFAALGNMAITRP